jgi:hypothetical protein
MGFCTPEERYGASQSVDLDRLAEMWVKLTRPLKPYEEATENV